MSLLDRYVGRIVLGAFGATLLFFLFITILMDLLNSLPKYANSAAENGMGGIDLALYLGLHYLQMVPVLFVSVTPFATVIACMFAVARLQAANEVVPMLFVGRSIHRILRPMLLVGGLAGVAMVCCWQWVVPQVGASLLAGELFLRERTVVQKNLVHETFGDTNQYLSIGEFDPMARCLRDVGMLIEGPVEADNVLVLAKQANWDERKGDWRLSEGRTRQKRGTFIEERPLEWLQRGDLTPDILLQRGRETLDPETQSYTDLLETIALRPNRADLRLALHRHFTYPLANLLLLLLALPLAVYFERGSRIERLLGAIALCGAYMLVDLTCQSLGQGGHLHPIVAAWTPTILFGALGITLFGSAKT
ncbi:MAG: LptF/LptG family permease [Planctomycetes bacterium]|nr:LptF/LptG family permease [Planctomycetota bacterium]MCB9886237.1 LptF/LptG family permease [Planctomycetota bacterium]